MKTFTVLVLSRYLSGLPEQSHSLTLRLSSAWREHSGGFTQGPSTLHILSFFSRLGETSGADSCSSQSEKKKGGESEREGDGRNKRASEGAWVLLPLSDLNTTFFFTQHPNYKMPLSYFASSFSLRAIWRKKQHYLMLRINEERLN